MEMNDMIMVSVDDHVIEPANMFANHTPAALKDRFPKVIANGTMEAWSWEGRLIPNLALNAVVGRRPEEYGFEPTSYQQIRRGCYDVKARADDMSANGVLAGLCFPTWPGVFGSVFAKASDKKLALEVLQRYNDWYMQEWVGSAPGRFIPCAVMPLWDPEAAAREVVRMKRLGCNSITLPPNPVAEGLPSWHQPYWDPVLKACEDNGVVINLHIADATTAVPSPDSAVDAFISVMGVSLYSTAVDLVFSPVFRKFPRLRFGLSEGGAGWVPQALERMDFIYKRHRCWTHQDFGDKLPSDIFREHFYCCIVVDRVSLKNRHDVGLGILMWECDYPHAEATWPRSPEMLWEDIGSVPGGIPDAEIDAITHLNAMKAYGFDPFKTRAREHCTVAALRAEARHVDLGYLPTAGIPPKREGEGVVSLRDVMKQVGEAYQLEFTRNKDAA